MVLFLFQRSRQQLVRPEDLLSPNQSSSPSELRAALSTSLARNARLLEQRRLQTARYLQLQRQVDSLSAELDASVDNLRHQRNRWEAEKRKTTLEARDLRQQLAKALASLQTPPRGSPVPIDGGGACGPLAWIEPDATFKPPLQMPRQTPESAASASSAV